MPRLTVGQHVDIRILEPGAQAQRLVLELTAIANTSASVSDLPEGGVRVHLTQADADAGAKALRKLAASFAPTWSEVITITPVREIG
ncbi:hypothetical protein [Solirubrobacter pauli]|uniref:hypothetical protein n=1 Tax=Solirubrobacter pauli TaxID=166793 RepID=UPI0011C489CA|nr:hypothetical protein [Solirubrobacter pauli]